MQFCLAHLIRDVKFLTTLPDPRDRSYGEALRAALKKLFEVFHQREQQQRRRSFKRPAERGARDTVVRLGLSAPPTQHGQNIWRSGFAQLTEHGLLHVRDDAGSAADEQPGGTGDPVRGDRQARDAGDAKRERPAVERADLDGDRDLHTSKGKSVYGFLREVVESSFAGTEKRVAAGPDGMRTRRHPGQRRQVEEADGGKANVSGTTESIGCKAVTSWEVSEANLPRTKDEGR